MKSFKYLIAIVVVAGLGVFLLQRNQRPAVSVAASQSNATSNEKTRIATQERNEPVKDASVTVAGSPRQSASNTIPLLNRNNPAYDTVLAQTDRSFLSAFKRGGQMSNERSEKELVALAQALSIARFSQTMYEATIADVATDQSNVTTIAVPPYQGEGENLKNYVLDTLLADYPEPWLRENVLDQFRKFGKYSQKIVIKQLETQGGEKLFNIQHTTNITDGAGPLVIYSDLTAGQPGRYTVFQSWFPKS